MSREFNVVVPVDVESDAPVILFVGSFMSFSNKSLDLLATEFPEFRFSRVDGPEDIPKGQDAELLHALIFEESRLGEMLSGKYPETVALCLAYIDAAGVASSLARAGIRQCPSDLSFLPMSVRLDAWLSILRLLLASVPYIPVELMVEMSKGDTSEGERSVLVNGRSARTGRGPGNADAGMSILTPKERQILSLISDGKQNKIIARMLNASENTVKLHVHHIISKLGVHNRTEAARWYYTRTEGHGD